MLGVSGTLRTISILTDAKEKEYRSTDERDVREAVGGNNRTHGRKVRFGAKRKVLEGLSIVYDPICPL